MPIVSATHPRREGFMTYQILLAPEARPTSRNLDLGRTKAGGLANSADPLALFTSIFFAALLTILAAARLAGFGAVSGAAQWVAWQVRVCKLISLDDDAH